MNPPAQYGEDTAGLWFGLNAARLVLTEEARRTDHQQHDDQQKRHRQTQVSHRRQVRADERERHAQQDAADDGADWAVDAAQDGGVKPQTKPATELAMSNRARVTMRMISDEPRSNGLTMARSIARPLAAATTIVKATARAYGSCRPSSRAQQMNAVNIANSPWAKLIRPIAR